MPELPEVETIRRDLFPVIVGRTVRSAWISPNAPRLVQLIPPEEFCRSLTGRRIEDIGRRGKYLLIHLDQGLTWIVHLRMTGRLQHAPEDCLPDPYLRARFELDDGTSLCFIDVRKFGTMWLVDDVELVTGKLGQEPLEAAFDIAAFHSFLKRRGAPIKAVLLDQAVLAGVGNIYADESLFAAAIDPRKPANKITRPAAERLHRAIVDVLTEAVGDRGSSFSDYVDGRGEAGFHHLKVRVYQRTDEPCLVCGTPIRRIHLGGRSTHFCPRCQKP
ncbi:MAG: bifunctional DNA-formamidopyrimidine glycosylase/DNA-(apurinic or apyrimidinic site) lyase [Dehalococcoidia bacterium]